jgi:hypothetical protein
LQGEREKLKDPWKKWLRRSDLGGGYAADAAWHKAKTERTHNDNLVASMVERFFQQKPLFPELLVSICGTE